MCKINLLREKLLWNIIQNIQVDEEGIWFIFPNDVILTVYSSYKILGSNSDDYSDLIWSQITGYMENENMYLLSIWEEKSIEISRREEDWEYEVWQLNIGDEIIVDNWD